MNTRIRVALYLALGIALVQSNVVAQKSSALQYAVKFICGKAPAEILSTGSYRTAINIHNPSDTDVVIREKFAQALPGEKRGIVTKWRTARLGPDGALEIDCNEVHKLIGTELSFVKGFVVIESEVALDVVAVYTAAGRDGEVRTLALERVPFRRLAAGCCDLIVEAIERPTWDSVNMRSVIRATIRNIGSATAGASIARVIDPTTQQSTGAPYNAIANTPALGPGTATTVTFYLPYWVYNPDVTLEVTADYKGQVEECDETNNTKVFSDVG